MRTFKMIRNFDASGVSGIGCVLEGVVFEGGPVAVRWLTQYASIGIYESFDNFMSIHVHSHPQNNTEIVWGE